MSLADLQKKRRIQPHKPTRDEIQNLLAMARQSFGDSQLSGLSTDWKYMIAYNAVLCLASAVLQSAGYRARGEGHHATLFDALPLVIPEERPAASYFDRCRRKRNRMTYSAPKQVSEQETKELHSEAREFLARVDAWITANHPQLAPPPPPAKP